MAAPLYLRRAFRHSIQQDSQELVRRIGATRFALADMRDSVRIADVSPGEQARQLAVLEAMLREAA